ncbi:hypothetical protein ACLOJK_035417 [Asimina triloba]
MYEYDCRVKFAGSDQQQPPDGPEGRKIRPSSSFKSERKKVQNWFLRQFSNQMSTGDSDGEDGGYKTAIAAVAFAIAGEKEAELGKGDRPLEAFQSRLRSKKKDATGAPPDPGRLSRRFTDKEEASLSRTKSQKDDTAATSPEHGRSSRRFTGLGAPTQKLELGRQKSLGSTATEPELAGKTTGKVPSAKKTLTFALDDKNIPKTGSFNDRMGRGGSNTRVETLRDKMGKADYSPPPKPIARTEDYSRGNATDTKADTWEKAQLAKIQKRYEKQVSTILAWEDEKKKKAKHQLDKKEARLELRRLRATQEYRNEIERVNKIAKDARAIAEERKRNGESKMRETANEIRSTGKVPISCFGFR